MIRSSKTGFGEASRRWSQQFESTDEALDLAELPKVPNTNKTRFTWQMMRPAWETIWSTAFIFGYLAVLAVTLPFIKLGLFHYQVWTAIKKKDFDLAAMVFVLACAPIDIGLIWGLTLVARGDLSLF